MKIIEVTALLTALLVSTANAQDASADANKNPYATANDVEDGRLLVRSMCGTCHGLDGTGGRAPNLTAKTLRHGSTQRDVFTNLQAGIEGTGMKGFELPEKMAWQIVSYIRQPKPTIDVADLPGDVDNGKLLFKKHECVSCHGDESRGGRRGQDLRQSHGTVEHVRTSILQPSAEVADDWRQVVLLTDDGRVLNGLLMNENSYYIQFMDEQENLHTVAKEEIEELRRPAESIMPSFREKLTDDDVSDLVSYVISLRKE